MRIGITVAGTVTTKLLMKAADMLTLASVVRTVA